MKPRGLNVHVCDGHLVMIELHHSYGTWNPVTRCHEPDPPVPEQGEMEVEFWENRFQGQEPPQGQPVVRAQATLSRMPGYGPHVRLARLPTSAARKLRALIRAHRAAHGDGFYAVRGRVLLGAE